jgi:hypothetical protein
MRGRCWTRASEIDAGFHRDAGGVSRDGGRNGPIYLADNRAQSGSGT